MDEVGEHVAAELGEAGQEEHVGGLQQLQHGLLAHIAVVRVDELDDAAEDGGGGVGEGDGGQPARPHLATLGEMVRQ